MPNHIANRIDFYGDQENISKVLELIKGEEGCIDFNKIIPMPKSLNLISGSIQDAAIQYAMHKKSLAKKMEIENLLKTTEAAFYGNYYKKVFIRKYEIEELEKEAREFEQDLKEGKKDILNDTLDYESLGIKTLEDLGDAYINNIIEYGTVDWYDWCCENWGTKWNAYDDFCGIDMIEFNTAWSCPLPVLDKLAEICYKYGVSFTGKWADEDCGSNTGIFESDCDGDEYWFSYEYMENCSNEAYEIYVELQGESECIGKDEDGNWIRYDCDDCPHKCY